MSTRRPVWPILAGLMAGAVGAVAASLASLPLRSPDDLIANTASVTFVALLLGFGCGIVWRRLHDQKGARRRLLMYAAGGFLGSVIVLAILEAAALDRFISFGVPLAAIIFAALGFLTPPLTTMSLPRWAPLPAVIVAMAVGGGLASVGDGESGNLSLDDLPVVTATPSTSAAPAAGQTTTTPTNPGSGAPLAIPGDLVSTTYSFATGTATWTVPETFSSGGVEGSAVGRSEDLSGRIVLAGESEFTVDLTTFVSDQDRRDAVVRRIFAAEPIARFTTVNLTLPATYTQGEILTTEVSGDLTINGVTRQVTWTIEARLTGNQLDVAGAIDIVLTDFAIDPPTNSAVTVRDSARLEVLFSAVGE